MGIKAARLPRTAPTRDLMMVDFDKKSGFATVEGKEVKKKRCNILHLMPIGEKGELKDFSAKKAAEGEKTKGS